MCGIVGIVGGYPCEADVLSMLARVKHRGPDGDGVYMNPRVGLGHARLAIIDLSSTGAQPMQSPDGRYTLIFCGEIYNHADFRPALEAQGVRFRGHSDTETLLWLLVLYGERVLPRLNGIFAFAFYDRVNDSLLLARDHMGVKPLYYARGRHARFLFSSEIKALFATGDIEPRLNRDDITELLMFHFIAGERTAFDGVFELLPGHSLRVSSDEISINEYWDPTSSAFAAVGTGEIVCDRQTLCSKLQDAVGRQLMSDVPVGIMLSGGIDSGIIASLVGSHHARLRGFCFRDTVHGYDECVLAKQVAEMHGMPLEVVEIHESEIPELLTNLTWYYDEPIPRPHFIAAYAVAKKARQRDIKVLLSGEGGDELFGGYSRYAELAAHMTHSYDTSPLVFAYNRVALPRIAPLWSKRHFLNSYRFWCAEETRGLDLINRQLIIDQKTFLQHFLQRSDRMGMAAGVEIRVPLLDVTCVEYANSIPGGGKIAAGMTKVPLRAVAEGLLPVQLAKSSKQPFDMPMASLLQRGPVANFLDDMLLTKPRCGAIFDVKAMEKMIYDFRSGQEEVWKILWMLLATEVWMRTFNVVV